MRWSERVERATEEAREVGERRRERRNKKMAKKLRTNVERWEARTAHDAELDHDEIFLNLAVRLLERGL